MPLLSLLRTPTTTSRRRYSYHRAIYLGGAGLLSLLLSACSSPRNDAVT